MTYVDFFTSMKSWTSGGNVAGLRRQMVLGLTPEFWLLSSGQLDLPASMGAVRFIAGWSPWGNGWQLGSDP